MTDQTVQLIALGTNMITALGIAWIGRRVNTLEKNTNSKMDALLTVTKVASKAEGVLQEKTRQEGG